MRLCGTTQSTQDFINDDIFDLKILSNASKKKNLNIKMWKGLYRSKLQSKNT